MSHDPRATWALEREIVLSRVIDAPRSRVFQAFTDPSQITRWFGPEGFTTETLEIEGTVSEELVERRLRQLGYGLKPNAARSAATGAALPT